MIITYDKEADAAYIYFHEIGKTSRTVPVSDDIVVDFGQNGKVMGVEVLNAKEHIDTKDLKRAISKKVDIPIVRLV